MLLFCHGEPNDSGARGEVNFLIAATPSFYFGFPAFLTLLPLDDGSAV